MKRRDEDIARAEFDSLTRRLFPTAVIEWNEVPQADEPPDWCLTINRKSYAVEATSIVERLPTVSGQLSSFGVIAALHEFIDEVESAANQRGILSGAYVVSLWPIPDLHKVKPSLKAAILDYVRQTQARPSAARADLAKMGHHTLFIQKFHDNSNYVTGPISFDAKWEGQAQLELSSLVANALAEKEAKLKRVSLPVILLLLDTYRYSDTEHWVQAVCAAPSRTRFECICRIDPSGRTSVLWAKGLEWLSPSCD